jgi:hypothetical protein
MECVVDTILCALSQRSPAKKLVFKSKSYCLMNSPSGSSFFDGSDGGWNCKHGAYYALKLFSKRTCIRSFMGFPSKIIIG